MAAEPKFMLPCLEVRDSGGKGRGVFASQAIEAGSIVLFFTGDKVSFEEAQPHGNMYLQCSAERFLIPVGGVDDFTNHSCDPNGGLKIVNGELALVALRDIKAGEEINFDYSTSTDEGEGWEMACCCGSAHCRGVSGDWRTLPKTLQDKYLALGVVPAFIAPPVKN